MFTTEEAFVFVRDRLKVKDAEGRIVSDRKSLLDDVIVAMHTELIFQNLRLLSIPPAERHRPTVEEIKSDLVSGAGGLCYNLNVGAHFLLQALGYKAYLAAATCTSTVMWPMNHVVVYVCDLLTPGDRFLVEVGFGFPTYRAVPLDFDEESPVYVESFLEYKYVRHDGKLLRMHRKGCPVRARGSRNPPIDFYIDDWRRFYMVEDPVGMTCLEDLDQHFHHVFTNPEATPFHRTFRVIGFPGKKAVLVVDKKLMTEKENGELEVSQIDGGNDGVVATLRKYFPALQEKLIRDALDNHQAGS